MEGTPFGQYRLIELLGRGGMGEVWRAYDTVTDRIVALKVLPANFAEDATFQQRFRREAHAAAQLNEPHVVPIHTYGEINGRLFVDMRLIDGHDLQSVLAAGPLAPARAVRIIEQVAHAVHAAHKVGLVHRDIKPSNILLDENDFAYLIDFGIARAAGDTGLTATGGVIGTLRYMAPERFSSGQADARSDIYALACVLYECLTGDRPFPGNSLEQQLAGHLASPPPRPSMTGAPAQFDSVIATGMAKKPEQRYASTVELARAAQDAITTPLPPRSPGWAEPATQFAPTQPRAYPGSGLSPMATPPRPAPTAGPKRWLVPVAILAVLAVVGGGWAIWKSTRPQPNSSPTPGPTATEAKDTRIVRTTSAPSSTAAAAIPVVDFRSWQPFGGIDAQIGADGRSVVLDTHDTVPNWRTAWSGVIAPGPQQCSTRITGRARDISHSAGNAGGFGIGLAALRNDSAGAQAIYGSAVQYDLGLMGYFAVSYPGAEPYQLVRATLDNDWHTFDVAIDTQGRITAQVDGKSVIQTQGNPVCGMPTIRVWAGSAEFSEFSVQQAD